MKINVTQPFLPPLDELTPYLKEIWADKFVTNGGKFHQELESRLCDYLNVQNISLFTNATIALVTAIKALDFTGEVITTPFSFVATSHSLLWNNIQPVFVDIDYKTLNIDPSKVEAAVTKSTSGILPVHCFGHPCNVDEIDRIANKYHLKVLYDAAHAFGVDCHCGSVLNHGDLSVLSFHATKVFNTFEGGAIISHTPEMKDKIDKLKNFGYDGEVSVVATGINGKMSEFNAALGLLQLDYIDSVILAREKISSQYRKGLNSIAGIKCVSNSGEIRENFSYFPILIDNQFPLSRDQLYTKLRENGIYARKYFFPLISNFEMYKNIPSATIANLPVANMIANQILCLPIYPDLNPTDVETVIRVISQAR